MDTRDTIRAVLLVATLQAGFLAGLFLLYAHTVMPGLGATDDQTFVGAFQSIDRKVNNWVVFTTLFGAPALTALVALGRGGRGTADTRKSARHDACMTEFLIRTLATHEWPGVHRDRLAQVLTPRGFACESPVPGSSSSGRFVPRTGANRRARSARSS